MRKGVRQQDTCALLAAVGDRDGIRERLTGLSDAVPQESLSQQPVPAKLGTVRGSRSGWLAVLSRVAQL
jgi:hypothetical protein